MIRAVLQSIAATGLAGLLLFGASAIDFLTLCKAHRAWVRRETGASLVIRTEGPKVARPGDAIYSCTSTHCFGGNATCHVDLGCYCAPATMTASDVARFLDGGSCTLERPFPFRDDESGACRHAACDDHIP